jgi:hypothetical protein
MSKNCLISIGLLSVAWIMPMGAQTNVNADLSKFNFNIGGGIDTPLNPTGRYVGVDGNFLVGAGYNVSKQNAVFGEFGWTGLPSNVGLSPLNAPNADINLYTLTANYRYHLDRLGGSAFGAYLIAGGGWYYRHININKNYVVPPATVCLPIYSWYGYSCSTGGVVSQTIFSKGSSSGGVNAGAGFTIRLGDSGWKFYMESRYNIAFTHFLSTTYIPVTFGIRFN